MNENKSGVRMIDAEDLSWCIASLTHEDVQNYISTHEHVTLVPTELVLELIDKAE